MIKKNLKELQGNEILAKPIMTWDYQIIMPQGASIKKEYIDHLDELGITEVYVKEDEERTNEIVLLKADVQQSVKEKVQDILERHTYHNNQDLVELSKQADNIISVILEEETVLEKIFDIKERSTDIYEHSINICSFAILISIKLGIDKQTIHDIGVGCLLHDIGLRYTTVDFVNQDVNAIGGELLTEYKKHPINGYSSLKNEIWISELSKKIILHHHERKDGSGFPLQIKDIPRECMIVNVCDTFDEMICGIASKKYKVYEAIEYLRNFKNVQFDAQIVDTFLEFTAVYPAGTHVITNEGELAVVVSQNKDFPDRPIIRIIKDKNGNDVKGEVMKNLVQIHNIFIEKVVD